MSSIQSIQKTRTSIFQDVMDNKIPERVPVNIAMSFEAVAEFGGVDLLSAQWNPALIESAADKVCSQIYSDVCLFQGSIRFPSFYTILESQSFVIGSSGFIQHPEVVGMLEKEYDRLIESAYDFLLESVIPRQYKALDLRNPVKTATSLAKSMIALTGEMMENARIRETLVQKYGFYPGPPSIVGGFTEAAFDFLADQLRGFKGISLDVRRMPDKVEAAVEALYPIVYKKGLPARPDPYGTVFFPLHMPTFMREKDFARLYWPTFKRHLDTYASLGIHSRIVCEDDWMRYLDYLDDLPVNTTLVFEYGDPKVIKEKLGKKHIISGLYPVSLLKTGTKEQCIDKAKELIDILAPGGKYIFGLDKGIITANDFKLENLCAVTEYVRDYAVYDNPGEQAGMPFDKSAYSDLAVVPPGIESKYFKNWGDADGAELQLSEQGAPKLQGLEERMFGFLIFLLI